MTNSYVKPLISIIIVTYNASKYIERCLKSILALNLDSKQLIIIDGKSTDNTLEILKTYQRDIDVLISEPDLGIYDAMNKALRYIEGRWVYFMGADDQLLASFNQLIPYLQKEDSIYHGNCVTDHKKLGGFYTPYFLTKDIICHQSILYPAIVFKKYQYQPIYPVLADYVLNMQCWGDPSLKKEYVPIDIAYYALQGYSSYTTDYKLKKDKSSLIRKYLGWKIYLRYRFRKFKAYWKGNADTF
ncbi:glycosyltransferase [Parapedobacter tibetensis]|uniref:glycosyltransferase n=1 Tax=Parapedobacter tibetensis TaxID=2972951 RepID=UPI00214D3AF2|nr:glycosyltransferase [Parapedobacter tibetensis]